MRRVRIENVLAEAPDNAYVELVRPQEGITNRAMPEYIPVSNIGGGEATAPLTGNITKTLATSGGDFTSLTAFFDWVYANTFYDASVTLNIAAGTYTLSPAQRRLTGAMGISRLHLVGSNKTTCIIQNDQTGFAWLGTFWLRSFNIYVQNLTITLISATISYLFLAETSDIVLYNCNINSYDFAASLSGGNFSTGNCVITGPADGSEGDLIYVNAAGIGSINSSTIDNVTNAKGNCVNAVGGRISAYSLTVKNGVQGLVAGYGGQIFSSNAFTFTGNTANTNIPLRQIQYDGSYITDGASAMSFKT